MSEAMGILIGMCAAPVLIGIGVIVTNIFAKTTLPIIIEIHADSDSLLKELKCPD